MAVSVAVCEIFSVKEWCDLENRVRVRSRSLEIAPFDRSHTSSYSPSVVTMAISCNWLVENREIFIPHLYLAPLQGMTPSEFCEDVWCWWKQNDWATVWWKKLWRYVKPFSSGTRTLRTDGQTDRQIFAISISRVSMLTRDKNKWERERYFSDQCVTQLSGRSGRAWNACRDLRFLRTMKLVCLVNVSESSGTGFARGVTDKGLLNDCYTFNIT